jgi:hypothetical protein
MVTFSTQATGVSLLFVSFAAIETSLLLGREPKSGLPPSLSVLR